MVAQIRMLGVLVVMLLVGVLPARGLPAPAVPRALTGPGAAVQPPDRIGNAEKLTLPNLAPLPPYDVFVGPAEHPQGPVWSNVQTLGEGTSAATHALRFTTTIQNRGRYSFELVGAPWVPDSEQPDLTTAHAYQCVRFTIPVALGAQRDCARYDSVGTLTWHAQHHHFHIDGFGSYELRRDLGGHPDMSKAGLVGTSQKVGWCVSDMYNWREDTTPQGPGWETDLVTESYERNWYQECTNPVLFTGASWRQGISPGWADTYPAMYTGQEIPLRGVPEGIYWIVTTINPKDNGFGLKVQETTWADNTSASRIQLYDGGRKARLLGPKPAEPYRDWYDNPPAQPGD